MQDFVVDGLLFYAVPETVGTTVEECDEIKAGTAAPERISAIVENVRGAVVALMQAAAIGRQC